MNDHIILSADDFQKIFTNAYAVVIDGILYDVYNDYETEDGKLCTAFVLSSDYHSDVEYVISPEVEKGRISYNPFYKEFYFEDAHGEIPSFKILTVAAFD